MRMLGKFGFSGQGARPAVRSACIAAAGVGALAVGAMTGVPALIDSPAIGEVTSSDLPAPPADGVMGFVVEEFYQPIVNGTEACPDGPALNLREAYLESLPAAESKRLLLKENEKELTQRWRASAFGANETNVCSQPDMFERPMSRTVQSPHAWGLDLDGKDSRGSDAQSCGQQDFVTPSGVAGIDNQEYRAQGCKLVWRSVDGLPSDQSVGMKQFLASGEWTQVLLLKGVDSLVRDDEVEVVYANTPDRPYVDNDGKFLPGTTFAVSDELPRHRNVLRGKIINGVLTTEPADIKLTQTWGQGGARDIRGHRTTWDYRQGRLQLAFRPDGSLEGLLGGYRPIFDVVVSHSLGGAGSALVAGLDCAAELSTLKKLADGLRNPATGQCEGVSSAVRVFAIPAFVNDLPRPPRVGAR